MTIPQLRLRTEFSFKQAFGPVVAVAAAAQSAGAPVAGIVDGGTWGHVRWAAACEALKIQPAFGTEVIVPVGERRPAAWVLARNMRDFYNFSSAIRREAADPAALLKADEGRGLVRFAGAALTDPETIDYIDINPESPLATANAIALAKRTGKPLVITSANYYPAPADKPAFLAFGGRERTTPQHILSLDELRAALPLPPRAFDRAVRNTFEAAELCASQLPTAPLIKVEGDFRGLVEAGRKRRLKLGHLKAWTPEYAARLDREVKLIEEKKYESYFLVVADLVNWAKTKMLVGPGRGSSAGSLLCYLVGITEVDPIPHGLLFERFVDVTRFDLPDIDLDFNDEKRDMVFTYLREKYGDKQIARIGNVNTLQGRSVIATGCKRFGIPDHEKFALYDVLPTYSSGDERYGKAVEDVFLRTDVGKRFADRHPEAMIMTRLENHASHTGIHAAGVIVCNEEVTDYCTVGADGVAQFDKHDAVKLNLLKIDALGLKTLGIIEDAGVITAAELYSLSLDDPKVFEVFNKKRFCGIFEFDGPAQRSVTARVHIDEFRILDHLTALARPGPLGAGAEKRYADRKKGLEKIEYIHHSLAPILGDTYGVVLYQEQIMKIVRELGDFSWSDTSIVRKSMSGRKGADYLNSFRPKFIEGAANHQIDGDTANQIWDDIYAFGNWGMNRAHTCAYSVISYWCAYLKAYFPLEYAAAVLRKADEDAALAMLRELAEDGRSYVAFDPKRSLENWSIQDGELIGGFMNLVGIGPAKAASAVAARNNGQLDEAKYLAMPCKFADIYPLQHAYRSYYENPEEHGIAAGSRILTSKEFPTEGDVLYLGKVITKRINDCNDDLRVARRDGKRLDGPNLFIDFHCKDDHGERIICRIDRFNWDAVGRIANEKIAEGDVLLIRGRRLRDFPIVNVLRMRCLNKPGVGFEVPQRRKWRN